MSCYQEKFQLFTISDKALLITKDEILSNIQDAQVARKYDFKWFAHFYEHLLCKQMLWVE